MLIKGSERAHCTPEIGQIIIIVIMGGFIAFAALIKGVGKDEPPPKDEKCIVRARCTPKGERQGKKQGAGSREVRGVRELSLMRSRQDASLTLVNPYSRLTLEGERIDLGRILLEALGNCKRRSDFLGAAKINSYFASEGFRRAKRTLDWWLNQQDKETGLFPERLAGEERKWITQNSAADLHPFLVLAASFLDQEKLPLLGKTLESETKISGSLPRSVNLLTDKPIPQPLEGLIFGASEYCKDGLLPLTERLGKTRFFQRMQAITEEIYTSAPVESNFGKLPSELAEVNGNMLQVLCRLFWASKEEKYLRWAERIGDAYLLEAIPNNFYLPPYEWDFREKRAKREFCQLRDHGNEIIAGLIELYLIESVEKREREKKYYQPLRKMLDKLLGIGRNKDGFWYNRLNSASGKVTDSGLCDNWGYLYNAYLTFYLVSTRGDKEAKESGRRYVAEIEETLRNLPKYKSYPWEGEHQDGFADSIESALYLLSRLPIKEGFEWVDSEIQVMFAKQSAEGFTDADYLDGNFIRTALLFAFYKTQGTYLAPWREDLLLGAFLNKDKLFLHLEAVEAWSGRLFFDYPRHKAILGLPLNYPRLNEWPEWFVVEEDKKYKVSNLNTGESSDFSGSSLRNGLELNLTPGLSLGLLIEPLD